MKTTTTRFLAWTGCPVPGIVTRFIWRETDVVKHAHAMQLWHTELASAPGKSTT